MRTTTEGLALIKGYESCSLSAYWDGAGKRWTIGWGRARNVAEGDTCSQEQADAWFLEDVAEFERLVLWCVQQVSLTDNQLSALVSFVFNVGMGEKGVKDGFHELFAGGPSTMLACLLLGDFARTADEFPKWVRGGGTVLPGLVARRAAERALFLKTDSNGPG